MADINNDLSSNGSDITPFIALVTLAPNHQNLKILGDYDTPADFSLDSDDLVLFWTYYYASDTRADLNNDSVFDSIDYNAFNALYNFGIHLTVVS